ncbi:hypothetical protein Acy02nite_22210 [Actinoplanes cyaneus]|uniref:Uncharacterized protein n=1 Tax=Actinoplanes cyaneus TaxID=52696 RepID=A0A919LZR2_9ACTN|nr:hypothetical protein [Actinoplanes cyaneus]MCW2136514.1 hypothetical protein [Actinoplanes cyaneus]GID64340.1 hypothetical protein Acy02nite_22210 [Actinoplanes cyaneus]
MTTIILCPACLTVLPQDYPHDHVAIDRALTTQPERFATMSRPERREVVLTGLDRGTSITALAALFRIRIGILRALLPAEHPESAQNARNRRAADLAALEAAVRSLWTQGLPDTDIALRTGHSVYAVLRARRRLGLAALVNHHNFLTGGTR